MPRGFTKLTSAIPSECAVIDTTCRGALVVHLRMFCGGGDYTEQDYWYCAHHANEHARLNHHKAETVAGFETRRDYRTDLYRIDCRQCGTRSVVEGTIRTAEDWDAALHMVLTHNEAHHVGGAR